MLLDENTYYLNEYMNQQDQLEKDWVISLPECREAVVDMAKSIMRGDVDQDTYYYAFSFYYFSEDDEYCVDMLEILADWEKGETLAEDEWLLKDYAMCALEAASQIIYNTDVEDLISDGYRLSKLVEEVIRGY